MEQQTLDILNKVRKALLFAYTSGFHKNYAVKKAIDLIDKDIELINQSGIIDNEISS